MGSRLGPEEVETLITFPEPFPIVDTALNGATPLARQPGSQRLVVLVEEDALGRPVEVLVLARAQRPEERREPEAAERERDRDEDDQRAHPPTRSPAPRRARRSALRVTTIDEADIAIAAMSGVTRPAAARGAATAL